MPTGRTLPLLLAPWLALSTAALAGPIDGVYQVVSITDPHGKRTAEALQPEGCWSRELWVLNEHTLMRGHQESCPVGKLHDVCEVWVTVEVAYGDGLTVPYSARAKARSQRTVVTETSKRGNVQSTQETSKRTCQTRVDSARFLVTIEEEGAIPMLKLTDKRREIAWVLEPTKLVGAPFSEVAK